MNVKRIIRLLKLLQTLQSGNKQNASGLARACGVSRRTIFRDLETLKTAGVPLEFDHDGQRYSIAGSFFLPPTNLTAAEALSLIALASEMGQGDRLPFYDAAHSAVMKLESSLPASLRDEMHALARAIRIRPSQVNRLDTKAGVYQQLVDAIAARRVVRIEYQSLTEWEHISTRLRPYQLLFSQHSWYVIGRSSTHGEVRTFNLSRISSLEVLDQTYTVPRGFSLERYMGNAWNMIPAPGQDFDVVVRFQPMVAQNVAEVVWHKTQQVTFLEDGSLEFRARVSGLSEIVWWVLGYGDQAEVIQPARLRREVAQRAQNMMATYNGRGMT